VARSYSSKTVKLLFGRARRCAYPGCSEGLILEHRGQLTVIAEIAHIRSEKPDGPRYDPEYPESLIDQEENLLLLCAKHHKPVDDHDSVYPTEELLEWKRKQVADRTPRELSDQQVERIFRHYDLGRLGPDGFEKMCQALAIHTLGPGTEIHSGYGPDGGRDASFDGRASSYPSSDAPWDGLIVMEAMYSPRTDNKARSVSSLSGRIRRRLDMLDTWSQQVSDRGGEGRPDYVIFATNLQLSAVRGGGIDRINELIRPYANTLGLKGWAIWHEDHIAGLLDRYRDVREAVGNLTMSNEIVAELLARLAVTATPNVGSRPPATFAPGQAGHEAEFQPVYEAVGGAERFGPAMGEVREHELGWVQHFAGGPIGEPSVLCARFGKPVVAAAREVWNDIEAIGSSVLNGGATGVGFPIASKSAPDGYIASDAKTVELAGGRWGRTQRGRLLRHRAGATVWQPQIAFDSETFKDRDTWSSLADKRDLRVRVAARIPLFAEEWRITGAGRARMLAAMERSGLAAPLLRLATRYSLGGGDISWEEIDEPDGLNNSRFAAYQIVTNGVEGRPALAICIRLVLPDGRDVDLRTTVDLRVNFANLAPAPVTPLDVATSLRLRLADLIDFFTHAWPVATTELVLAATDDPLAVPPAGAPRLELYIQSERPDSPENNPTMRTIDMVDLSALGSPRTSRPRDLSIGVTTPLSLPPTEIVTVLEEAILRMVEDAGFVTPPVDK
jgi:hypothetical protein